jgi:hypothetical protein
MRRASTALALCLGLLLPLAGAGAASADVPASQLQYYGTDTTSTYVQTNCMTRETLGVVGVPGAWGDWFDGCTTPRATCPVRNPRPCQLVSSAAIGSMNGPYRYRVTQNARIWIYASATAPSTSAWADRSCSGTTSGCYSEGRASIAPGQAITTQCNGVREHVATNPSYEHNSCYQYLYF